MSGERRIAKRSAFPTPVRYQQKGGQAFSSTLGRDISETGIGFVSNEFFPISTQLIFETQHPESRDFIKAAGEVVWVSKYPHSERFSVGARFLGPLLPLS
ncbi:MAG: PilZ domain-containing protein [Candidatus Omnitrophica bacterium]|nr:PilZ domain-containing protein [Candidatus Omnitrophota bacterium]MBU3912273.1 PilZ domain-containing protein [Candidatus Omnitrophota bacterium]MBU4149353.1 PilZ domain-containing protein [Candidatus Omnitrophota bacterium]